MTPFKPLPSEGKPEIVDAPTLHLRRKRAEDTPEGCRALAEADLQRAEALTADQAKWRYQHSANAWLARADMLSRLEAKFQERVRQVKT